MKARQKTILNLIIKEYIKTALPVGSAWIGEKSGLKLSPATIRNEMMELEQEGYLRQPHTSAGRVPTEKGFRFYIENLKEKNTNKSKLKPLEIALRQNEDGWEVAVKNLAKTLAELATEAVFVGFAPQNTYYTGLANLFAQPEFSDQKLLSNLTEAIDAMDDKMEEVFDQMDEEVKIMIGEDNPFASGCGAIFVKYHAPRLPEGVIGILGPMRMDYENNLALLRSIKKLLTE